MNNLIRNSLTTDSFYAVDNTNKYEKIKQKHIVRNSVEFQKQLSKIVFRQRKKLKLTQAELSEISGVDRSMISKIETLNQPVTLETAIKLLSALNIGIVMYYYDESKEKFIL